MTEAKPLRGPRRHRHGLRCESQPASPKLQTQAPPIGRPAPRVPGEPEPSRTWPPRRGGLPVFLSLYIHHLASPSPARSRTHQLTLVTSYFPPWAGVSTQFSSLDLEIKHELLQLTAQDRMTDRARSWLFLY